MMGKLFGFIKKRKWWVIGVFIILLIIILTRHGKAKPVPIEKISRGDLVQTLSITGSVAAEKSVDLAFKVGGLLTYLGVQEGDWVKKYQTIATEDERTAQKNLEAALIDYAKQRNTFDQTQSDNQNRTANTALNDDMKRVLQDNQYDLNAAVNSVELKALAEEDSILTTPIAGIVTRADVSTSGVNVTTSTTFTVTDPNSLDFVMEVDEGDVGTVKLSDPVSVSLDSYPNSTMHLSVSYIDFVSHKTSTGGDAFYVKAKIPGENTTYHFRDGMDGNADIETNRKKNVLLLPLQSLVGDNKVYVKTGNTYTLKTVKLGLQNDTSAEVLSGLSEGDLVVTDPSTVPQSSGFKL